jgi:xanthine/uracil/vitamin C permease (AzgA family)
LKEANAMRVVMAVIGLLVVIAAVAWSARGGLRAGATAADAASAPADLSQRQGQGQSQQDLERSLQQGADKAMQSGY